MKPATLAALMLAGYACAPLVLGLHGAQVLLAPLAPEYIRDQMPALARFPIWDLTRRAGGAALLGLGALQLRGWSRGHRERGRAFSAVALLLATGGVWMAAVSPFGPGELAPAMVFALALLGSIILGILAIRAGLGAEHRRWMRRAFALALGPLAVRAVHMLLTGDERAAMAPAFWIGWPLPVLALELSRTGGAR